MSGAYSSTCTYHDLQKENDEFPEQHEHLDTANPPIPYSESELEVCGIGEVILGSSSRSWARESPSVLYATCESKDVKYIRFAH